MPESQDHSAGGKRNKRRLFLAVAAASALLAICWMVLMVAPMEGEYTGPLLDAVSREATFVLKDGHAFVRLEDDLTLFGNYSKTKEGRKLYEGESTNGYCWVINRNLIGFDLVCSTNADIRYHFNRSWVPRNPFE
jgi:hypothetical protein